MENQIKELEQQRQWIIDNDYSTASEAAINELTRKIAELRK